MKGKGHITVRVTRHFNASAERVFDAWLDPQKAGKWLFATPTGQMARAEIDGCVGGKFLFVDRREGKDYEHWGEYLEIDRPRRLVFTFSDWFFKDTRVTIEIAAEEGGCELTLTHERVPKDASKDTESGWKDILEGLARTLSRKQAAASFLKLASSGKVREAYQAYVGTAFKHHNPYFKGDADSLMKAMEKNAAQFPEKAIEIHRMLEDGDLVAIHARVVPKPGDRGVATTHIFRFEGDQIIELWDLGQAVPEDSPNLNGMF